MQAGDAFPPRSFTSRAITRRHDAFAMRRIEAPCEVEIPSIVRITSADKLHMDGYSGCLAEAVSKRVGTDPPHVEIP